MAVGPFEPVASCVTGSAGVARERNWFAPLRCHNELVGVLVNLDAVEGNTLCASCVAGRLKAICVNCHRRKYEDELTGQGNVEASSKSSHYAA